LGLNDLNVVCSSEESLNVVGGCADGLWTTKSQCPASTVICGYILNFQSYSSTLDNTAANDITFYCCLICKSFAAMYHMVSDNTCQICDQNCLSCYGTSTNCTDCGGSDIFASGICNSLTNYLELEQAFNNSLTFNNDLNTTVWLKNGASITQGNVCGIYSILGPFSLGDTLSKTNINGLHPHYRMRFKARIYKIDYWNYEKIDLSIDGTTLSILDLQFKDNYPFFFGNMCENSLDPEDLSYFDIEFPHSKINPIIEFSSNISSSLPHWGISHIVYGIYICESSCLTCSGPSSVECLSCFGNATLYFNGSCICNDGFLATNITISGSYIQTHCLACSTGCKQCSSLATNGCITCFPLYYFINNQVFFVVARFLLYYIIFSAMKFALHQIGDRTSPKLVMFV